MNATAAEKQFAADMQKLARTTWIKVAVVAAVAVAAHVLVNAVSND